MTRIPAGTALLLVSFALYAQPKPAATPTVPPPVPVATPAAAPAASAAGGNPFAPRAATPTTTTGTPFTPGPFVPPKPTEDQYRENTETAFRGDGHRVGRVNGLTFFKLEKSYLFVETSFEDRQPVVSPEKLKAAANVGQPAVPSAAPVPGSALPIAPAPMAAPGAAAMPPRIPPPSGGSAGPGGNNAAPPR